MSVGNAVGNTASSTQSLLDECENTTRGRLATPPRDAATLCSCESHIESGPAGNIVVLQVAGEIDRLTVPTVHDALTEAMDRQPADLVIDLSAVSFCCVRGFALLATTARAARSSGIGCAISGMTPHLDRVASMLWPEQRCVRYRSAAAAVTAIRIDQTYRPA